MFRISVMPAIIIAGVIFVFSGEASAEAQSAPPQTPFVIKSFLPEQPLSRAQRPAEIAAVIANVSETPVTLKVRLILPEGVLLIDTDPIQSLAIAAMDDQKAVWKIKAADAKSYDFTAEASAENAAPVTAALSMMFLPALEQQKLPYIPEPRPIQKKLLVGAHHCPLWEADKPEMWAQLIKHPERTPALGFYAQENPEISDWETKWAVEHGVDFFIYCWYRASQGGPVQTRFSSAIHDGLFKSKFAGKMKFTIMWENQSRGVAGVADEHDLMANLLPYWIENYFKHPSYLKIDNKPLLFIYRPEFLIDDLGSIENAAAAFSKMRQACREAGFGGLYLLGEYRGLDEKHLALMKQLGLDYTFAYCWYVPDNPTPAESIDAQMQYIKKTQEMNILPQVVTLSQAWSGWADEGTIWKIPPAEYKTLLAKGKEFIANLPENELGSKMLLLDNWNEWGEGHYIAPYREYGFGYLDAVREVLAGVTDPHTDLIPEDIGLGPYDTAYKAKTREQEKIKKLLSKKICKRGAPEEGLIAWWTFDEDPDCPIALDFSGNRLGGKVIDATRAPGMDGNALMCGGGCVSVEYNPRMSPPNALSIECWVKTDLAGQDNTWIVNHVFGGGIDTGYRLGVLGGKPCFEVPLTDWSHHLKAKEDLPTGRWVHLVGTFDGTTMRIYADGVEQGSMERTGAIKPNTFKICLGSYEQKHASHFTGLLDEVKLYGRTLSPEEVSAHYCALSGKE